VTSDIVGSEVFKPSMARPSLKSPTRQLMLGYKTWAQNRLRVNGKITNPLEKLTIANENRWDEYGTALTLPILTEGTRQVVLARNCLYVLIGALWTNVPPIEMSGAGIGQQKSPAGESHPPNRLARHLPSCSVDPQNLFSRRIRARTQVNHPSVLLADDNRLLVERVFDTAYGFHPDSSSMIAATSSTGTW